MRAAFLITTVFVALSAGSAAAQAQTQPATQPQAEPLSPIAQKWQLCMRSDQATSVDQAIAACSAIIESGQETQNNMAVAYFNRANAGIGVNPAQSEADYTQAITLGYAGANAYYGRGIVRDALARYDGAIADYTQALTLNPNFADALANRGNVYQYGMQDYDHAIADYTAAIAIGDNPIYRGNRGNAYQYGKHDLANAVADYDRAIQLAPSYASAYVDRANAHVALHENDQALADYHQALTLEPNSALAHFDLGNLYSSMGERDQAVGEWSAAISADPHDAAALGNRAAAYADAQRFDLAAADYDAALTIRPDASDFFGRGKVRLLQPASLSAAIADFDQAATLDAGDAEYKAYACMARAIAGTDLDAARAQCDAALTLASDAQHAEFLTYRGLVGLKQLHWQDAWNDFNAAATAKAGDAVALYGRGIADLQLGEPSQGHADLTAATTLQSDVASVFTAWGVTPPT